MRNFSITDSFFRILYLINYIHLIFLVRPNPPAEVKMTSDSPTSIDLWYKIDDNLHYFPPGLKQDVQFRSQYDLQDEWKPIKEIGMISHKKSLITIFGHKHKINKKLQKI